MADVSQETRRADPAHTRCQPRPTNNAQFRAVVPHVRLRKHDNMPQSQTKDSSRYRIMIMVPICAPTVWNTAVNKGKPLGKCLAGRSLRAPTLRS